MNNQNMQNFFWKTHKNTLLLFLCLIFGLIIRSYNLGSHNLWFDEVITFVSAKYFREINLYKLSSFMSLLNHHLYYLLLNLWTVYFGKSELALRSLSMIFGILSIPLIYKLGKLFFNERVGLISAFILSISPIHIWYSQEARGYSLSTFLVMSIVYFYIAAVERNKLHLWIGFIVSSILAVYSNYFCFYIIISTGALIFLKNYRYLLKRWLESFCFILIAFLPQLPNLLKQSISIEENFWIPRPHLSSIVTTLENFNVGYNATAGIHFFTFILFSSLLLLGIQRWWQEKRKELISLISFLFIPIIFTFLISQKMPIYLDRQLMLFSPFYYIIVAAGLEKIELRVVKIIVYLSMLLAVLLCLHNYFSYRIPLSQRHHVGVYVKKPVKPAADYIDKRFAKGDIIGFSEPSSFALSYYIRELINREKIEVFSFVIKSKLGPYWRGIGERERYGIYFKGGMPFRDRQISVVILDEKVSSKKFEGYNFKRLWLISSSWARDGILDLHAQSVREWMRIHYSILESREFDGIFVDLYCSNPNCIVK